MSRRDWPASPGEGGGGKGQDRNDHELETARERAHRESFRCGFGFLGSGVVPYRETRRPEKANGPTARRRSQPANRMLLLDAAWLFALAIGLWIPIFGVFRTHNYATLIALVMAFAGAYGGSALRGWLAPARA